MPYCPNCKTEYKSGVKRCHDCGAALVETLNSASSAEVVQCFHCGGNVTPDSDFCVHCGTMLFGRKSQCETHRERTAIAVCVLCHRLLCSDCARKVGGRFFCEKHQKVEVEEDWAVVFQSLDIFEASVVRTKLEGDGINISVQNDHSIGYFGFMDTPIGRTNLEHPVKLFVPFDQYVLASQLLVENEKS
jgi:hypothetical protein